MIVPYAAGGGVDIVARTVSQKLGERLGVQILVDNRPGGSSNIGSDLVAKAAPDGYTLLMASPANVTNMSLFAKPPYDVTRDLSAVALVGSVQNVFVVHPSLPARTVQDVIALAKARPGQLSYASGGNGSTQHLAGELFKRSANVDILHIPYKGGAPAMTDVMGGQVAMAFINVLEALPHVKSQRLRAVATTGARRTSSLAQVPTIAESGLAGFEVVVWWGVMAPARTPAEIIARLNGDIARALEAPEVRDRLVGMGADVRTSTASEFASFVRTEVAKWSRVIKDAGIRID